PGVAAAVALDGEGHANPVLAGYRVDAVRAAFPGPVQGGRAKRLLDLPHVLVAVPGVGSHDVDTPSDLARLRREWHG
ncbi:MAG: molybdenum cofactor guanylyltransferase, partial [Micrococcales bacterium]|nr:molybdenum cofactor guanylyltransferase [Micrococcales bacterium]